MSKKLYVVIGLLTLTAAVIALIGITYLGQINTNLNEIVNVSAEKVKLGARLNQDLLKVSRAEKNILLAATQEEMDGYAALVDTTIVGMVDRVQALKPLVDKHGGELLDQFAGHWDTYLKMDQQIRELARLNSNVRAKTLSQGKARDAYDEAVAALETVVANNEAALSGSTDLNRIKARAKKGSLATQVSKNLVAIQRDEKNLILAKSQEDMDGYAESIRSLEDMLEVQLTDLRGMAEAGREANLVGQFADHYETYKTLNQEVVDLSRQNGNNKAFQLAASQGRDLLEKAEQVMTELVAYNEQGMDQDKAVSDARYTAASLMMVGVSVGGILVTVLLAVFILKNLNGRLAKIVKWLSDGAQQTAAASGQVSQSSQELAEGASEQAASVEETSASLEEMASMIRQNAAGAKEANVLAADTRETADTGNTKMEQMLKAIQDVNQSSEETARIIKTIDEIAFQTNLLALNAAVEAARAGESGQGFAVVAEEVRNLAQRAADAAKDTAELIDGSRENTKRSAGMVDDVAQSLGEITTKARQMNDLVAEIAAASDEQDQGIGQINTAVSQIDQVTQSMASNAEESAAASEELNAQAETLTGTVRELTVLVEGVERKNHTESEASANGHRSSGSGNSASRHSGPGRGTSDGDHPAASPSLRNGHTQKSWEQDIDTSETVTQGNGFNEDF